MRRCPRDYFRDRPLRLQLSSPLRLVGFSLLLLLGCGQEALAQARNPFDLIPRLDSTATFTVGPTTANPRARQEPSAPTVQRNPFDLVGRDSRTQDTSPIVGLSPGIAARTTETSTEAEGPPPGSGTFYVLLVGGLLLLLAGSYLSQAPPLRRLLGAAFNENLLSRLRRDPRKGSYLWWALVGYVCTGAFAFVLVRRMEWYPLDYDWRSLGIVVGLVIAAVVLKIVSLGVLRAAFPLEVPIDSYLTLMYVAASATGLLLFPVTVFAAFSPPVLAKAVALIGLGIIVVSYLLRALRAVLITAKFIVPYPLHFLVYLCALEIGPAAVVYKLLTG